jgi:hypothetical protein
MSSHHLRPFPPSFSSYLERSMPRAELLDNRSSRRLAPDPSPPIAKLPVNRPDAAPPRPRACSSSRARISKPSRSEHSKKSCPIKPNLESPPQYVRTTTGGVSSNVMTATERLHRSLDDAVTAEKCRRNVISLQAPDGRSGGSRPGSQRPTRILPASPSRWPTIRAARQARRTSGSTRR